MPRKILILNGPNLNMLGQREPDIYGHVTLDDIRKRCEVHASAAKVEIDFRQSNTEGQLVDWIQQAHGAYQGIVLNAGAYTHTSIAILDALRAVGLPVVEVHLSNIHQRESYRRVSYVAEVARGMICGFGAHGYLLALDALCEIIERD